MTTIIPITRAVKGKQARFHVSCRRTFRGDILHTMLVAAVVALNDHRQASKATARLPVGRVDFLPFFIAALAKAYHRAARARAHDIVWPTILH